MSKTLLVTIFLFASPIEFFVTIKEEVVPIFPY